MMHVGTLQPQTGEMPLALIVGAGPSGLCFANLLQKYRQKFVIIDAKSCVSSLSKATGIHRNTLKLLDKLNFVQDIAKDAIQLNGSIIHLDGKVVKEVTFEQGQDPNDKNLSINQANLERIFSQQISNVKFDTKLVSFEQSEEFVSAVVQRDSTSQEVRIQAKYLIACDGAKSSIRKSVGIAFQGERTPEWSFTFDAQVKSTLVSHHHMLMFTKGVERLVLVPIPEGYKFSGRVTDAWHEKQMSVNNPQTRGMELAQLVFQRSEIEVDVETISGFSFYHTASKVASSMQDRRVILLGDAAHVFFPAGGYGLNTAVEDTFCLAWRLSLAVDSVVHDSLLRSFCHERLKNALAIQEDSTQKKKAQELPTQNANASQKELETQAYSMQHTELVRLETVLPLEVCKLIKSNRGRILADVINKNIGFTFIVNSRNSENVLRAGKVAAQLNSSLSFPFTPIHVCDDPFSLAVFQKHDECFDISSVQNKTLRENLESIVLIRPDNFIYCIPITPEFNAANVSQLLLKC